MYHLNLENTMHMDGIWSWAGVTEPVFSFLVIFKLSTQRLQYIPRNMHTVFALLCFVVVIHWLIFPYPSGLLHWHCGNLTIAPVPAKQPWWIWINTSCEFIMNDCITTTKQSTTKPCAYFLGYTVPAKYHAIFGKCHSSLFAVTLVNLNCGNTCQSQLRLHLSISTAVTLVNLNCGYTCQSQLR